MRSIACWILLSILFHGCGPEDLTSWADQRTTFPIVNGTKAPSSFWSSGALVIKTTQGNEVFCSGTLISKKMVLTAATCLDDLPPGAQIGFFSWPTIDIPNPFPYIIDISKVIIHPDWVGGNPPLDLAVNNDIAVAILLNDSPYTPMKMVRPKEINTLLKSGAAVTMVGFGQTAPTSSGTSGTRRFGVSTVGQVGTHELHIKVKSNGPQRCTGDIGGPALGDLDATASNDWRLIGLASRTGKDCTGGSVETRVDPHLSWIHKVGTPPCGSGLSPDCTTPPPPPPPHKKGLGEKCTIASECAGNLCVSSKQEMVCSQRCSVTANNCPSGYACMLIPGSSAGACVAEAPPPPPARKSFGESCLYATDCQSSLCVLTGSSGFCTIRCGDAAPCPGGYLCQMASNQSICAPGADPPPRVNIPQRSGCAVGGHDSIPRGQIAFFAMLLLLLVLRRRAAT